MAYIYIVNLDYTDTPDYSKLIKLADNNLTKFQLFKGSDAFKRARSSSINRKKISASQIS